MHALLVVWLVIHGHLIWQNLSPWFHRYQQSKTRLVYLCRMSLRNFVGTAGIVVCTTALSFSLGRIRFCIGYAPTSGSA